VGGAGSAALGVTEHPATRLAIRTKPVWRIMGRRVAGRPTARKPKCAHKRGSQRFRSGYFPPALRGGRCDAGGCASGAGGDAGDAGDADAAGGPPGPAAVSASRGIGSTILKLPSFQGSSLEPREKPNTVRTPLALSNSASVSKAADVPPMTLASETAMI